MDIASLMLSFNFFLFHLSRNNYKRMLNEKRNEELVIDFMSGMTYQEIGKKYDITRERVRQIIKVKIGSSLQKKIKNENMIDRQIERALAKEYNRCPNCGKKISISSKLCRDCFKLSRPRQSKEQLDAKRRAYYARPEIAEKIKRYHQTRKYKKYQNEYRKRPEVIAKIKALQSSPEYKEKQRAKMREYNKRPDVALKRKLYYQKKALDPKFIEKRRKRIREYARRPEVRLKRKQAYENRKLERQNNNS
jgi:ribosomal protein S14